MSDQLEQDIKNIVAEILEIEPESLTTDGTLDQIMQIDSVAMLEVLVTIERKFQVNIKEEDLQKVTRLGEVIELVREKLAEKGA